MDKRRKNNRAKHRNKDKNGKKRKTKTNDQHVSEKDR